MITKEKTQAIKNLIAELNRTVKFALSGCGNATAEEINFMNTALKKARDMTVGEENSLDIYDVCEELGLTKSAVYKWVERGWLPKPAKKEKLSSYWSKKDIEEAKKYLKEDR